MIITIELAPETEATLAAEATALGRSLQQHLRHVLEGQVSPAAQALTPGERAALWRESAANLPRTPALSDRATSRDNIYDTRG
jgi:hypothetical protein